MSNLIDICNISDILPNTGRAALIGDKQIAIFNVKTTDGEKLFAIDNLCPFSGVNVLSRGIIGSVNNEVVVASPLYKQHFILTSGQCVEDDSVQVNTYDVTLSGDKVQLAA